MRLRVDEEVAAEHDFVAERQPARHWKQIIRRRANRHLARFKDAIGLGHIDDLPRSRVEHRGAWHNDRLARRAADKRRVDEHPRQQPHAGIGDMHMHGDGARLRTGLRLDEVHMPVQRAVGQRLRGDLHLLPATNLRQLVLIDIRLDPHLAEIGDRKQRVARVDVLPLRHLALHHASRRGGIERSVRNAARLRRVDLLFAHPPKLQLALACTH